MAAGGGDPHGPLFGTDPVQNLRNAGWIATVAGIHSFEPVPGQPGVFAVRRSPQGPAFPVALGVDAQLPPGTVRPAPGGPAGALAIAIPARGRRIEVQIEVAALLAGFVAARTGAGATDLLGARPASPGLRTSPGLRADTTDPPFSPADHAQLARVRGRLRVAAETIPVLRASANAQLRQALVDNGLVPTAATAAGPDDAASRLAAAVRAALLTTVDADTAAAVAGLRATTASRRVEEALTRAVAGLGGAAHQRGGGLVDLVPAGAPPVTARVVVGDVGGAPTTVTAGPGGLRVTVSADADPTSAAVDVARWATGALLAGSPAARARPVLSRDPLPLGTARPTLAIVDQQARAELSELAVTARSAGRFGRSAAVNRLVNRADELGLRLGARDAAARRALLSPPQGALAQTSAPGAVTPQLATELSELIDDRRPAPAPAEVLASVLRSADPATGELADLTAAVGVPGVELDPDEADLVWMTVPGGARLPVRLLAGAVPGGAVALTRPDPATITLDDRAQPTAALIAVAGGLAELAALNASAPTGPPLLRPGPVPGPITTADLTVADRRALAQLRAAVAHRQVRGRAVPAAEAVEALGRELGLLGAGDAAVIRRGTLDPATERALAELGGVGPVPITQARQQIEAIAARYSVGQATATATRLSADRIRLEVGGVSTTLTVRTGARTAGDVRHAPARYAAGIASAEPVLTVLPNADPLLMERMISRVVAAELSRLGGVPAGVTHDDVGAAAELVTTARQAGDRRLGVIKRRSSARDVATQRAVDLDPAAPGGERRYERLRAAGLIDADGHAALAALLDADAVRARRETRNVLVRAAEQAGATAVEPVGDGIAVVTLPNGDRVEIEVADGRDTPEVRTAGSGVLTALRPASMRYSPALLEAGVPVRVEHGPADLVALAGEVAARLAERQHLPADGRSLAVGPVSGPLSAADHTVTDVAGLARLRVALSTPELGRQVITQLGLAHDTNGAAERRATLPADLRADVERLDGAAGTHPAVRTGLATLPDALDAARGDAATSVVATGPNQVRVRFADPQGGADIETSIAVYRDPDPDAPLVRFTDDAQHGLTVLVSGNANPARLQHALTVAVTRWTRRQLTPTPPAQWGPERLTLPLDPQRWTPTHYARAASLRVLLRQLGDVRPVTGRLLFQDAILRSRIRQLSGQLGVDRGVARAGSRLDLLVSRGVLSGAEARAMLGIDRPGVIAPIARSDDRRAQNAISAARTAISGLAGEHGIAEVTWKGVDWDEATGAFQVRLDNGRSFELEVVAGTLVATEAADGPLDPTGRLASVTLNQRRPTLVTRGEWQRRVEREAVAQTIALAARQPGAGESAATARAAQPTEAVFHPAAPGPDADRLTPDDRIALGRFSRWVRQYDQALAAGRNTGRSAPARAAAWMTAHRVDRQLDLQLRLLGLDAGAPGVERRRIELPDDVRAALERRDGSSGRADAAAVLGEAGAAVRLAARLGGFAVQQPAAGEYRLIDPVTGTSVTVAPAASGSDRDPSRADLGRGLVIDDQNGTGPTLLRLSPWLDRGQVERAIGRAVGELMTGDPHRGRVLEVSTLVQQIQQTRNPVDRARLRARLGRLTRTLGLNLDAPDVAARRAAFADRPEVLSELRRADRLGRHADLDPDQLRTELQHLAPDAGVTVSAPPDGVLSDPHQVDLTLADGTTARLLIVPDQTGEGSLADGRVDPVLGPVLSVDSRADGLARQAALVRELARIVAQLERIGRGLPPDAPGVLRPGRRTDPIRSADLAPDDWALAAEGRFLARAHAHASAPADVADRLTRRWIRRRVDVLAQAAGVLAGEPGGGHRRAALPAEFGTLLANLDGAETTGPRTLTAEAALATLTDRLGMPLNRVGRDPDSPDSASDGQPRYLVTLPTGDQVRIRIFVDSLGPGVVARTQVDPHADGDLVTLDVSETANAARIHAAVTGELAEVLGGYLGAAGSPRTGHRLGVPDVVDDALAGDLTAGRLTAADFAALNELRALDQVAQRGGDIDRIPTRVSRTDQRRATRSARELVTRLGLAAGAETAPALRDQLPAALRPVVARYDGSRTRPAPDAALAAAADAVRLAAAFHARDGADVRAELTADGIGFTVQIGSGPPIRLALATAPPAGSAVAALADGETAAGHLLGPASAVLLVSPTATDAALEAPAVRAVAGLLAQLDPGAPHSDPEGIATLRLLVSRLDDRGPGGALRAAGTQLSADRPGLGPRVRAVLGALTGEQAGTELRLRLVDAGLAADQPGVVRARAALPADLRAALAALDGELRPDKARVHAAVAAAGSDALAADAGVAAVAVTPETAGWQRVTATLDDDTTVSFLVGVGGVESGLSAAPDPADSDRVRLPATASRHRIEAALARTIATRVAANATGADQLVPHAAVHARGLSARDRGELAFLRTIARLEGLRATPSSWFTETAARLGLHPGQTHAVERATLVLTGERDVIAGQRVAQLDDPWTRASRNRNLPGLPTGVPSRATYRGKAASSTGAALLATSVLYLFRGEPTQAVVALALAAAVPYTAGTGEWVTRVRSRRSADVKDAQDRAKAAAADEVLAAEEKDLVDGLARLTARGQRVTATAPVTPSTDVVVPADRLDPHANPLPYRRPRSAVLPTRSYLRKTAPAPLVYGGLIGYVVFRTRVITPFQAVATGAVAGVSGSIGEWLKYRGQEREQDRDSDRQHDRDFETRRPNEVASQVRRDQQREFAATLRAQLTQAAIDAQVPLPADLAGPTPMDPTTGPHRVVDGELLGPDDLAPYSLRTELPSLAEHLVKSGTAGVGLGTTVRTAVAYGVSLLIGPALPVVVPVTGLVGGVIGTVVGGVSESRMQHHWDRLRRERERDEGELAAHDAAERAAEYAATLDDLRAAGRILTAFGLALDAPELRVALPEPTRVPTPSGPPRVSGRADLSKLWDRSYLPRTVPAAIAYLVVGVPLSLLIGSTKSLLPGLSSRLSTVVAAFGDKWADGAEKDRAGARQAPHRARMAHAQDQQRAQRADIATLSADLDRRLAALARLRRGATTPIPAPPHPGGPG